MTEAQLNIILKSRYFYVPMAIVAAVLVLIHWWMTGNYTDATAPEGIVRFNLQLINDPHNIVWVGANFVMILVGALLLLLLNKRFSFLGGITSLTATLYVGLQCCIPALSAQWNDGSLVAVVVMLCILILFGCYEQGKDLSPVFLIFFILSLGSMWRVAFLYLIPLFFIGVIQQRIFSLRSLLAILFGLATPYWIALGLGLVPLSSLQFPRLHLLIPSSEMPSYFYAAAVLAIIGIAGVVASFLTLMKYRLQLRVYNGFILIMSFFVILLMIIDSYDATLYFPLLIAFVAIQTAHWYNTTSFARKYLVVFAIFFLSLLYYAWII